MVTDGIPTVYKFIEKADKKFNCRIIFFLRNNENQIDFQIQKKNRWIIFRNIHL